MDKLFAIKKLNAQLLAEMPELEVSEVPEDLPSQRRLLRALMNVRPPMPLTEKFLALQDEILSEETAERGIVSLKSIPDVEKNIKIWQGDITRLAADAIVNAANSALLGCFIPLHGCIDNAIHSAAGLQLRAACKEIIDAQGHEEPAGRAKITPAFNLPSRFVIHTVGPIIPPNRVPTPAEENLLALCYNSCLELAVNRGLKSIAFCCISTGEFHFPNRRAAEIAVENVRNFLATHEIAVVFNVFKDLDAEIYREILCRK